MSGAQKRVPEVRFKGFTDDWEQRKLGEIVERVSRKNINLESALPLTISAQHGLVDQVTFFNKQVASKDVSNYYLLKNGEFAYNKSYSNGYPWGAIKRLDNYEMGVLSTLYITFKPKLINSNFLVSYYDTNYWHREVSMRAAEGARNHGLLNISAVDFFDTELIIPQKEEEQIKIGNFFKRLDELIALHQRKLELLKQLKQAYLQVLFTQRDKKSPKVRFAHFEEDWEQRELSSLVDRVKSYSLSRDVEMIEDTGYKYVHYGDIHTKVADVIDEFSKLPNIKAGNYDLLKKGDLVVADASEDYQGIATPAVIAVDTPHKLVAGLHTIALRPKQVDVDSLFLYFLFKSPPFRKYGYKTGTGMKVFGISVSNLLKFEGMFPLLQEQIKIGNFFKQADELIALHQKKETALKELKKLYLQKLFV